MTQSHTQHHDLTCNRCHGTIPAYTNVHLTNNDGKPASYHPDCCPECNQAWKVRINGATPWFDQKGTDGATVVSFLAHDLSLPEGTHTFEAIDPWGAKRTYRVTITSQYHAEEVKKSP